MNREIDRHICVETERQTDIYVENRQAYMQRNNEIDRTQRETGMYVEELRDRQTDMQRNKGIDKNICRETTRQTDIYLAKQKDNRQTYMQRYIQRNKEIDSHICRATESYTNIHVER